MILKLYSIESMLPLTSSLHIFLLWMNNRNIIKITSIRFTHANHNVIDFFLLPCTGNINESNSILYRKYVVVHFDAYQFHFTCIWIIVIKYATNRFFLTEHNWIQIYCVPLNKLKMLHTLHSNNAMINFSNNHAMDLNIIYQLHGNTSTSAIVWTNRWPDKKNRRPYRKRGGQTGKQVAR